MSDPKPQPGDKVRLIHKPREVVGEVEEISGAYITLTNGPGYGGYGLRYWDVEILERAGRRRLPATHSGRRSSLMPTYRKKPVEIEAVHLFDDGANAPQVSTWIQSCGGSAAPYVEGDEHGLIVYTLEGPMKARPGWWVIRGVVGEFYPCDPGVFAATYEAVDA
jgi:hypothetical protein